MTEKSLTKIEDCVGKKIQVIAYGASYVGRLLKVHVDDGYLIIADDSDRVTIELGRVDRFVLIDE